MILGDAHDDSTAGAEQEAAPVVAPLVITLDNYFEHYHRLVALVDLTPHADTAEAHELDALGDAIEKFEKERYG